MASRLASPLLSCVWLRQQLATGLKNIRVIDSSWHMDSGRNAKDEYNQQRIDGAVFVDVDELSDPNSSLPHMLPSEHRFSEHIGKLGITAGNHVVIYDNNAKFGMFSAARMWWMFRVFGHQEVSVLDGGLPKWLAENHPVVKDPPPSHTPVKYTAALRKELVKNMEDIVEALRNKNVQVVDARSSGRFAGTEADPHPGVPSGHMVGAINLPFYRLFNPETKTLSSKQAIQKEFEQAGVDLDKPLIASCGSGITACWIAFAASLLGKEIPVYDGSWTEYVEHGPTETIQFGVKA